MRVAHFCFFVAIAAALAGMSLGVYMGIAQDFTLAPAHAHANLLGWVTMALYGLYHRSAPRADTRLAWVQAGRGAAGAAAMSGGLGYYLATYDEALVGLVIAGSLFVIAGMLLFLAIVVRDARQRAQPENSRDSNPSISMA
ncbi:MAG: hypothetical protein H0T41_15010 [Rhodobacteraceae bacterium]|nr:hypothetical protein [Paracoccaceae bacterium]